MSETNLDAVAPAPWPRAVSDERGIYMVYKVYAVTGQASWFVPSQTQPGCWRLVTWWTNPRDGVTFTCSCPYGQENGNMHPSRTCRHVRLSAKAEKADGIPDRPKAPIGDTSRYYQ